MPDERRHAFLWAESRFITALPVRPPCANFTVCGAEIALAKIRSRNAPFASKVCYIGCGVTTGLGAW